MEQIDVVNVDTLQQTRSNESNTLSVQVKILYTIGGLGARTMIAMLNVSAKKDAPKRRINRRIHARATEWLYEYFDGEALDSDCDNVFLVTE